MHLTKVFIHGLEGSSQGTKGRFFRKKFPDMMVEDFRGPLEERMEKLEGLLDTRKALALVGSSFGGLMATIFGGNHPTRVKRLILLAPALSFEKFGTYLNKTIDVPTIIFHGRMDHVVPVAPVRQIAQRIFPHLVFTKVEDDHMLTKTFIDLDWDTLLMEKNRGEDTLAVL